MMNFSRFLQKTSCHEDTSTKDVVKFSQNTHRPHSAVYKPKTASRLQLYPLAVEKEPTMALTGQSNTTATLVPTYFITHLYVQ